MLLSVLLVIHGHVMSEAIDKRGDLLLPVGQILSGLSRFRRRPIDDRTRLDQPGTHVLQPVAKLPGRQAVVAVVTLDGGHRSLVGSIVLNGERYALNEGHWYPYGQKIETVEKTVSCPFPA